MEDEHIGPYGNASEHDHPAPPDHQKTSQPQVDGFGSSERGVTAVSGQKPQVMGLMPDTNYARMIALLLHMVRTAMLRFGPPKKIFDKNKSSNNHQAVATKFH